MSNTRWICQHASCEAVHRTLPFIIQTLSHFTQDPKSPERRIQAKSLQMLLTSNFCLHLVLFEHILLKMKPVAKMLQSSSLNLHTGAELVKSLVGDLEEARNNDDGLWKAIKIEATELIEKNELSWEEPKRPIKPSKRLQDAIVTDVVASRSIIESDHFDHFRVHTFLPLLDRVTAELGRRFSSDNHNILRSISCLDPESEQFLDAEGLAPLALSYGLNLSDLRAECQSAKRLIARKSKSLNHLQDLSNFIYPYREPFFELYKIIQIAMTLPVTSAACERSFSRLRMIKTYLRNSMADDRLDNLATIAMHRHRSENLDMNKIVLQFAGQHKNRRIVLI